MEIKTAAVDVVPARGAPKRSYAHLWEAVRNARTGAWTEIVCDDLIELHRVQSAARGNRTLKMKTRSDGLTLWIAKVAP